MICLRGSLFTSAVVSLIEELRKLDHLKTIDYTIGSNELKALPPDNFKLLAKKNVAGINIGINLSYSGWAVFAGTMKVVLVSGDFTADQIEYQIKNIAKLFYDFCEGRYSIVLNLISHDDKSSVYLPAVALIYSKKETGYILQCVTFPYISGGWKKGTYGEKFADIETKRLKIVEGASDGLNPVSEQFIRLHTFPFETTLVVGKNVKSLDLIKPIKQRISFPVQ